MAPVASCSLLLARWGSPYSLETLMVSLNFQPSIVRSSLPSPSPSLPLSRYGVSFLILAPPFSSTTPASAKTPFFAGGCGGGGGGGLGGGPRGC
jgi:hypothetical protein